MVMAKYHFDNHNNNRNHTKMFGLAFYINILRLIYVQGTCPQKLIFGLVNFHCIHYNYENTQL